MPNTTELIESLETYQDEKAILKITEQELNSKYEKDRPGYFKEYTKC